MQGRVNGAFRQVEMTAALLTQGFDHSVTTSRTIREDRQQEKIKMAF